MTDYLNWGRFVNAFKQLLPYLPITLKIVFWATVFGVFFGMLIAKIRIHKYPVLNQISYLFISFMRGTPLLVQMMVVYYGLPVILSLFGIDANRWGKIIFAYAAYAMNQAAFLAEMFRGAIEAIPVSQNEAAYSVGLTKWQTFRRIVLPQAIRIVLPSFGSDLVGLFQGTSLVYLMGVVDIMGRAKTIGTSTGHFMEPYLVAVVVYVVISICVRCIFHYVDSKRKYAT
ncbi:MAG: amino acid ABC transporter permease [Lachnospiraceae bacterium]